MASQLVDKRDVEFVLYEQLDVEKLTAYEKFGYFSRGEFDMVLDQAFRLAENEMAPANADGDRTAAQWKDGAVTIPAGFHRALKMYGEGGWVAACEDPEDGGQGLPVTVFTACNEVFHAANTALNLYPSLAHGTATMIKHHGTPAQKEKYLSKLLSYEWAGTMNLTEPGAGSALAQVQTKAVKMPDGRYKISGQKIFITGGEHDAHPNIIHPVLARIEGDPAGIKGISIFLVPKYHVNDDGSLGARNDVTCAGIEHKMGIRGSATCQMSFGDNGECIGEILGKPCQGIAIMFLIMNEERLNVGVQSVGLASAAYLNAREYAKVRKQGTDIRTKSSEPVAIIRHPDVRRNLLGMKALLEGLRAMNYLAALYIDMKNAVKDDTLRKDYDSVVELLTPLAKAYSSIRGFDVCSSAMNVYGGYGYCQDYPVEQFLRDQKITALYEGTNAIHSIDLVARKIGMNGGRAVDMLLGRMKACIEDARTVEGLADYAAEFEKSKAGFEGALAQVRALMAAGRVSQAFQDSLQFLEITGDVILGWLHLWQMTTATKRLHALFDAAGAATPEKRADFIEQNANAAFYSGKIASGRYYMSKLLPVTQGRISSQLREDYPALEVSESSF